MLSAANKPTVQIIIMLSVMTPSRLIQIIVLGSGACLERKSESHTGSGFSRKYQTRQEMLDRDKHSSLFGIVVSDEEKTFFMGLEPDRRCRPGLRMRKSEP